MTQQVQRWMGIGVIALVLPIAAAAQQAFTRGSPSLRAGPAGNYPLVARLAPGQPLQVIGCTRGYSWCDVVLPDGLRGWVAASRLDYAYADTRVPILTYGATIGIPIVTFVIGDYWGNYYRDRPWYGERRWWGGYAPPPPMMPGWHPAPPPVPGWRPNPWPGFAPHPGPMPVPHPGYRPPPPVARPAPFPAPLPAPGFAPHAPNFVPRAQPNFVPQAPGFAPPQQGRQGGPRGEGHGGQQGRGGDHRGGEGQGGGGDRRGGEGHGGRGEGR